MTKEEKNIFKMKADFYEDVIEEFKFFSSSNFGSNIKLLKWLDDFYLFNVYSLYDFWIIHNGYKMSVTKYQRTYYAKQAALLCYELLSDEPSILAENFNELFLNLISEKQITERAKSIRKKLNRFRNEVQPKLKQIREIIAAHRDHNVSKQVRIIEGMNNEEIIQTTSKYTSLLKELTNLFTDVIKYIRKDQETLGINRFIQKYTLN